MDKTSFLKLASVILILSVLFTPIQTEVWKYLLLPGIVLGAWWFVRLS